MESNKAVGVWCGGRLKILTSTKVLELNLMIHWSKTDKNLYNLEMIISVVCIVNI